MAIIIKTLGANTITGAGTTTAYAVPASRSALVKSIRLANGLTGLPTAVMNLSVRPSGSPNARLIHNRNFTIAAKGSLVIEDVLTLGQGDALEIAVASGSQDLGYMINGIERE